MTKLKNWNFYKTKKTHCDNSKTQIVTKLEKKLKWHLLVKTTWHLDNRWSVLETAFRDSRDVCNVLLLPSTKDISKIHIFFLIFYPKWRGMKWYRSQNFLFWLRNIQKTVRRKKFILRSLLLIVDGSRSRSAAVSCCA